MPAERRALVIAGAFLAIYGLSTGSVLITLHHTGAPSIWPANAVALAMALLCRRCVLPLLLGAVAVVTALGNLTAGRDLDMAAAFGMANLLDVLVVWAVLTYRRPRPPALVTWIDLRRFIVAVAAGSVTFAGCVALINQTLGPGQDLGFVAWAAGSHLAGFVLVVPLVMRRPDSRSTLHRFEVFAQVALLVASLALVLRTSVGTDTTFLLLPALLWAAARFPARWSSAELATVGAILVVLTVAGIGPFAHERPIAELHAVTTSVQTFLVLASLVTLAFATSVHAERAAVLRYLRGEAGMLRLIESAEGTAFVATDPAGVITYFSTGAERLLGYASAEVVGKATPLLFHDPKELRERAAERGLEPGFATIVAEADGGRHETWTFVSRTGTRIPVSLNPTTVHDDLGRPLAYLMVARDISEIRAAEEKLRSALHAEREANQRLREVDQAKDAFVANVSHELRTPLATIIGCTELLADGIADELSAAQTNMVERIGRNGNRLLQLIEDLLTLGAVSEGRFVVEFREVDLVGTVTQVLAEQHADGPRLTSVLPRHPVTVLGDPDQLSRLVGNLVANALKFTPAEGSVRVEVGQDAEGVRLAVVDTGVGIAPEEQELVFERFFRSSSAEAAEIPGTGLGLSIVRTIAEMHRAQVSCVSTPGQGSTFSVLFTPAAIGANASAAPASSGVPAARTP